jgi:hypothetical protein
VTRIPSHTVEKAPGASRPVLERQQAEACGWSSEQLAEAFVSLGLTVFTAHFTSYAESPLDLPASPPATAATPAGQE